ncbi:MAG: hypothetical protein ACYC6P_05925 [Ignavibacteriaceae bacterium]
MKKIIFVFILLTGITFSQEETLLSGKLQSGGFGAPTVKFTLIDGLGAVLVGGYGGWLINHSFLIGVGGYGLANAITYHGYGVQLALYPNLNFPFHENDIRFGYGGLVLEYIGNHSKLVHSSFSILIGAGNINSGYNSNYLSENNFFVVEPELNLEFNITTFFRINSGIGYRFISGIKSGYYSDVNLNAPELSLNLKFGKF